MAPRLVTLTSDLGAAYAAQMKAVLARSLSPGRVVDLLHDLPPHDVREAAFVLRAMASGFPPGTVHVAVVDPGVGGRRAPLVIACADGTLLVGPDNGVLSPLAESLGEPRAFRLDPLRIGARPRVGTTFDGRDVFAPAAARLANGTPPERLGDPAPFERLVLPAPERRPDGAAGELVHVDRFGNLISNVPADWVPPGAETVRVLLRGRTRGQRLPVVASYEALRPGRLGVLGSSFGLLEIAEARGSAARRLRARAGARLTFDWRPVSRAHVRR